MSEFREIKCEELNSNVFNAVGNEWMLITAGDKNGCNTMTASWGGLGVLWGRNVAFCFIRPERHTFKFTEENEYFSLAFFGGEYKKELAFCGAKSGRDVDKADACGFTTCFDENAPYFEQAHTVLICKKLFAQQFDKDSFVDKSILDTYYNGIGYHMAYVGEIVKILTK